MLRCKYTKKYLDKNGKIIAYKLVDSNNNEKRVSAINLKNKIKSKLVEVENLRLTSDGRLIDTKRSKVENKSINIDNRMLAFNINRDFTLNDLAKAKLIGLNIVTLSDTYGNVVECIGFDKKLVIFIDDSIVRLGKLTISSDFEEIKVVGGNNLKELNYTFRSIVLRSLDLSSLNTEKLECLDGTFTSSFIDELNLSNFKTPNLRVLSRTFSYLETNKLDLSSFDTSKVTEMDFTFTCACIKNGILDLSNFKTQNVKALYKTFYGLVVDKLDISSFDTRNVNSLEGTFGCTRLEELDLSNFDTSNVTNMHETFCSSSINNLNISNFNTSKVTNMKSMFNLFTTHNLDLSNFDTSNVTDMSEMFNSCNIWYLNISKFNTSKVTDMNRMFYKSEIFNLSELNFDTSKVKYFDEMFLSFVCNYKLDISSFSFESALSFRGMFRTSKIKELEMTMNRPVEIKLMFNACRIRKLKLVNFCAKPGLAFALFENADIDDLDISGMDFTDISSTDEIFKSAQIYRLNATGIKVKDKNDVFELLCRTRITSLTISKDYIEQVESLKQRCGIQKIIYN
ncbi:MAG: BspA family leucine-rich repeat surface protein [Lachnospiraceae bacterium]|nr:BspA family leucine-rich repeat surface protein [Lachnospiraceae bacterium]